MKQKLVIKVSMKDQKSRSKALKIAVGIAGVESASLQGAEKDQIQVTGEGVDAVHLTTLLRKGIGFSELVSVGPAEEKKEEKKPEPLKELPPTIYAWPYAYGGGAYQPHYQVYREPNCSIM